MMQSILDMLNKKIGHVVEDAEEQGESKDVSIELKENMEKPEEDAEKPEEDAEKLEGLTEEERSEILKGIFDDSFIQAENSPFMTYPDDKLDFLENKNCVDFGKIMQQYRNGEIDEKTQRILEIIVCHKYISIRQIWQMYLLKFGLYIKRDSLKKILERMADKGLIVGFRVKSSVGNANFYIYCPDYNGVRLYTALNPKKIDWKRTDTIPKTYTVKRSLAKNQFLISYLKYYDIDYELQPKLMWTEKRGKEAAVVPALQITFHFKGKSESIVFLIEIIRKYHDWEKDFLEKLIRYGQYMQYIEDTRVLKKYYIVICAESTDHVTDAVSIFYDSQYVKKTPELQDMKLYYTYDLQLLDHHYEKSLIDNLQNFEYNSGTGKWEKGSLGVNFEKKDWHNIEFKMEKMQTETLPAFGKKVSADKKKLAIQIYNIVMNRGERFPQSVTQLAIPLKAYGIDYKELGYRRLKELFEDIVDYYTINYENPTVMMVDCTAKLREIMENGDQEPDEEGEDENVIAKYFSEGVLNSRKWRKDFTENIFCFKNWEMTSALLTKMTHMSDLSQDGWLNVIAFSYHLAENKNRIMLNEAGTYICFDTGLKTFGGETMYLLAKKNHRELPEWVLEGISTVDSRVLGERIKAEFGIYLDQRLENE